MKKGIQRKIKRNSISVKEDEDPDTLLNNNEKLNTIIRDNHKHKAKHKAKHKHKHKAKHKKRKLTKEESNKLKTEKYIEKMKEFMEKKKKAKNELKKQKIIKACKTGVGIALVVVEIVLLCL